MEEGLYQFLHSWSASDILLWYSICCSCWLYCTLKAYSHIACRAHVAPMLFPCYAVPLSV